ncbi:LysM peptidoglycan-binding domain-containing protein [Leucothrix pacifica]|uniref:LysM domain-containing protein n=1 Tax=Leucothrix pacifica TaxID=1247513 RepID=A0A317CA55_9GAMM|nr:LysM domain-containing protein [Leucothrix pacifica]PWQ93260.1 hypothetical protein DKW60_18120 [Leucothrix pacifica]
MKTVNTVVISALLAVGLAGNAMAAPNHHGEDKVVKKAPAKVYRVRPGDNLYRIAARNHVSVDKLIKINGLWGKKASNLKVGMVLRLA